MGIKTILIAFAICLHFGASEECQYGGVNILVRSKQTPYQLKYKCLCPFNYRGSVCSYYNGILCSFSNQKVISYNPRKSKVAQLQFDTQCYLLKKKDWNTNQVPDKTNYYPLPLDPIQLEQYIKEQNYFINHRYDIIWANDTTLFDAQGKLIKNQSDTRSDQQILNGYPRYNFTYTNSFLNVPMFNSQVKYKLSAHRFVNGSLELQSPSIDIRVAKTDAKQRLFSRFNITVQKQYEEYRVSKIQLKMYEQYGQYNLSHRTGMNSAKWRIINPNHQKGTIIQPDSSKVPTSFWVVFIFLSLFGFISASRYIIKLYKRWKYRRQVKEMDKLQEQTHTRTDQQQNE